MRALRSRASSRSRTDCAPLRKGCMSRASRRVDRVPRAGFEPARPRISPASSTGLSYLGVEWRRWESNPHSATCKVGIRAQRAPPGVAPLGVEPSTDGLEDHGPSSGGARYLLKDSNLARAVCETAALPHELRRHEKRVAPARVELATRASEAQDQVRWWSSPLGESRTHAVEVRSLGAGSAGEGESTCMRRGGGSRTLYACLEGRSVAANTSPPYTSPRNRTLISRSGAERVRR